ncbi:MAG: hypothetical protein ACLVKO_04945 [Dysgonomonas sp.]
MKTKKIFFLLFVLVSTISFVSCNDDDDDNKNPYPKPINVSDYSLKDDGIDAKFYIPKADTVYVINSDEELKDYVVSANGIIGNIGKIKTSIDYNKYSLLLVGGQLTSGISEINRIYRQEAENKYSFNVDIVMNETAEAAFWEVSVLVPKLKSTDVLNYEIVKRKS